MADIKNNAITRQEDDFAQWYTDVCRKAELMDYSSVKGFIIYRPYGATIFKGEGAYTHNEEQVIFMVVSSFELKKAVELARKVDPHVFITAQSLIQVYGNFYIRPID